MIFTTIWEQQGCKHEFAKCRRDDSLTHIYVGIFRNISMGPLLCKLQVLETYFKIFEHTNKLDKEFGEHSLKAFRSETEHTSERNPLLSK